MCKIDISGYNDLCSFFHSIACHSIFRHILQSGRNIIPHGFSVFKSKYHLLSGTQNYSRLRHDKLIRNRTLYTDSHIHAVKQADISVHLCPDTDQSVVIY